MEVVDGKRSAGLSDWVWLLLVAAIGLVAWGVHSWTSTPAIQARNRAVPVITAEPLTPDTITDVSQLFSPEDPDDIVGRPVRLLNVRVLEIAGSRAVWIAAGNDARVLVVPPSESTGTLAPGQDIAMRGTVQQMPDWDRVRAEWNVNPSEETAIRDHKVYVQATAIGAPVSTAPKPRAGKPGAGSAADTGTKL